MNSYVTEEELVNLSEPSFHHQGLGHNTSRYRERFSIGKRLDLEGILPGWTQLHQSRGWGGRLFGLLLKLDLRLRPTLLMAVCRVTMWSDMF